MPLSITIITIANRRRTFCKHENDDISDIRSSIEKYKQIFTQKALVVGSSTETEIFSSNSITRIEIEGNSDLHKLLPGVGESIIAAIHESGPTPEAFADDNRFSGRVDFFFEGGDMLSTLIDSRRPIIQSDKVSEFTRLFNQGAIPYTTLLGGLGFMNSNVMTRSLIHAGANQLPTSAWRAESC